jgi:hypothetical protein
MIFNYTLPTRKLLKLEAKFYHRIQNIKTEICGPLLAPCSSNANNCPSIKGPFDLKNGIRWKENEFQELNCLKLVVVGICQLIVFDWYNFPPGKYRKFGSFGVRLALFSMKMSIKGIKCVTIGERICFHCQKKKCLEKLFLKNQENVKNQFYEKFS